MPDLADLWPSVSRSIAKSERIYIWPNKITYGHTGSYIHGFVVVSDIADVDVVVKVVVRSND